MVQKIIHPENSHVMAALIKNFMMLLKLRKNSNLGSGEPLREFMHVDDLAKAVLFCLEYWHPFAENAPKITKIILFIF